ncbi:MAG: hypothetical protein IKA88_01110 [Clostridia bacterium]|nr:hypothetical protein [Clostridia bacterium]
MTENIIQSITAAEAQAAEMKRVAQAQAATIFSEAEAQEAKLTEASIEACKMLRETQIKQATAEAEEEYRATLKTKEREAKEYCSAVLQSSEIAVSEIVRRITSGDR